MTFERLRWPACILAGLAVVAMVLAAAWGLGRYRRLRDLDTAARAWDGLARCLLGTRDFEGKPSIRLRNIELAMGVRVPADSREWPERCRVFAEELTAGLESLLDEPFARELGKLSDDFAHAMAEPSLAVRKSEAAALQRIDRMWELAAGLPVIAAHPQLPPLPSPAAPVRDLPRYSVPGYERYKADRRSQGQLGLIFFGDELRECTVDAGLRKLRCKVLELAWSGSESLQVGVREPKYADAHPRVPSWLIVMAGDYPFPKEHGSFAVDRPSRRVWTSTASFDVYVHADEALTVLHSAAASQLWRVPAGSERGEQRELPPDAFLPQLRYPWLSWGSTGQTGVAVRVDGDHPHDPIEGVSSASTSYQCRHGEEHRLAWPSTKQTQVAIEHDGRWSTVTGPGIPEATVTLHPVRDRMRLNCTVDGAEVTWARVRNTAMDTKRCEKSMGGFGCRWELVSHRMLCSPKGCRADLSHETPLHSGASFHPAIFRLGERSLVLWVTDLHGVQMMLAPWAEIGRQTPRAIIDQPGLRLVDVFVRGDAALVLLYSHEKQFFAAVRIDASGEVSAVRVEQ